MSVRYAKKVFLKKQILVIHNLYHSGERRFLCPICFQAFKTSDNFKTHLKTHSEDKKFACKTCQKAFKRNTSLTYHREMVHNGNKYFCCVQCENRFTTAQSLKGHTQVCTFVKKEVIQETKIYF